MSRIVFVMVGLFVLVFGVSFGVYLGFWVMFLGGTDALIEAANGGTVQSVGFAANLIRVLASGLVGWATCSLSISFSRRMFR